MNTNTNISSIICHVHNTDNLSELHNTILKKIAKQLEDYSHGKESKNKDISTCEYPIDFYKMLNYLHISSGMMLEDSKEIIVNRPDVTQETLGLPEFYCRYSSFANFLINKEDRSLKVWRLKTDCQADYIFLNAFKPFE
jgi:hypothetical protein